MRSNPEHKMAKMADCLFDCWLTVRDHYGAKIDFAISNYSVGYHLTREQHEPSNYSVQRPVDKLGPDDMVSAIDWVFIDAKKGADFTDIIEATTRLLSAHDDPHDGRVGSHNLAEVFGTLDGKTVAGRVHGRYSSGGSAYLYVVHVALCRQWADNAYVCRSVASVVTGESHEEWRNREHPRSPREG